METENEEIDNMSIKEIAKRANVSPATVSRVLNNPDYNCSSPEVRERIRKAAMELNYVPNEAHFTSTVYFSPKGNV